MTRDECRAASGRTLTLHVWRDEESGDREEAQGCRGHPNTSAGLFIPYDGWQNTRGTEHSLKPQLLLPTSGGL